MYVACLGKGEIGKEVNRLKSSMWMKMGTQVKAGALIPSEELAPRGGHAHCTRGQWVRKPGVRKPGFEQSLSATSCVTSGKLPNFSQPLFLHLWNR